MLRGIAVPAFVLIGVASLDSHSASIQSRQAKPTTNADIVAMSAAKLSDEVIVAAIRQAPTDFDVSPAGLIALKGGGVSDRVIQAMLAAKSARPEDVGSRPGSSGGVPGGAGAGSAPGEVCRPLTTGAGDSRTTSQTSMGPMVLTAPFAATDRALWGKGDWFTVDEYWELGRSTCDSVSLRQYQGRNQEWNSGLGLAVRLTDRDNAEVKVLVAVHNPGNNHDKEVIITVELLDGTTAVRNLTIGPLKVEEGHAAKLGQASFVIPLAVLFRQPAMTLRLTMSVRDI